MWRRYFEQTTHSEECDDGNNDNGDFCSAICKIEPAGSGGGGSSGGNSSGGGGSSVKLNNTQINVVGRAYPSGLSISLEILFQLAMCVPIVMVILNFRLNHHLVQLHLVFGQQTVLIIVL